MAATKLFDLVVKTGEYTNRSGETKARYENVGAVMRNDNGQFVMLKRTFNPAGVPSQGDSILISMFEPRADDRQGTPASDPARQAPARDLDDEIPF